MPKGQRAAPFTKENAAENGRKGGQKSGRVRRIKRTAREVAEMIMYAPVTDDEKIRRMVEAGIIEEPTSKKERREITRMVAAVGNMYKLASTNDPFTARASVEAFKVLLSILEPKDEEVSATNAPPAFIPAPDITVPEPPREDEEERA